MTDVLESADIGRVQARVAGALRGRGFEPGDRIGLCVGSSGTLLHVIMGALRFGVIPVVASNQLTLDERQVIRSSAQVRDWIDDENALQELLNGPETDLSAVPLGRPMHFTSGTTGTPKGVWAGVLSEATAARLWGEEQQQWGFGPDDVHMVCSPLHHSAPIRFAIGTLLAGGQLVIPGPFSAELMPEIIRRHQPTTTFCTPAHLQRLDERGALGALSKLRLVAHAGAPCPEPLKRRAITAIGAEQLWEFYGSTEGQFTVCSASEWLDRPGTVGRARAGRRLEIDSNDMVWCHTPEWARWEYWNDPERTAEAWRGDAFSVGDLGRLDDDGYLFLVGRRNDLIISGGVNVYPAEVERVLGSAPGVVDIAVFGRADDRWGQRVCAVVTGDIDDAALRRYAVEHLAAYKRPKEFHHVEAIPRVGLSKVRRSNLAADLGLDPPPEFVDP